MIEQHQSLIVSTVFFFLGTEDSLNKHAEIEQRLVWDFTVD
jgi:hypothetical protein